MIQRYRFGEIVIDGRTFNEDVVVFLNRVIPRWWRKESHRVQLEDLGEALSDKPEVLILGTGAREGMVIAQEVLAHLRLAEIELLAFDTRSACQTFNDLAGRRRVVAALHITC